MLSMMNIRLFRELEQANTCSLLSFSDGEVSPSAPEGDAVTIAGITVQELSDVYQQLYSLPEGLYVVDAPEGCPVIAGDVLTAFQGSAVDSLATLRSLQSTCQTGDTIRFTFYRQSGEAFSYTTQFQE